MSDLSDHSRNAIAKADAGLSALTDAYIAWAKDDAEWAVQEAQRLQAASHHTPDELRALFRKMHDIKGQGGTFEFHLVTSVGAIACNILRDKETVEAEALKVVELCAHTVFTVLKRGITGNGGDNGTTILTRLNTMAAPYIEDAG